MPETSAKISAINAEWRANISAAKIGKKLGPQSAEHRANLSAAIHKPEVYAKLVAAGTGRPVSTETRAKLSAINTGKKFSAEHRAKISAANLGNPKLIAARALRKIPFKDTQPELIMQALLRADGKKFQTQFRIKGINHPFDIAIPSEKLLIEIDGCWYHLCHICPPKHYPTKRAFRLLNAQRRLKEIDAQAEALGWEVVHIWEHDLLKP